MKFDNIKITYRIWKKYQRYTIYSIYRNVYDDKGKNISKEMIYRTTSPPKDGEKDE